MNKKWYFRLMSFGTALLICFSLVCGFMPKASAVPNVTQNQRNMVARADYFYGITWVAKETVAGWGGTFYKGNTYRIPYGQPIYSGAYVGYGATFEQFIQAANTAGSIFYTQRSWYDGPTAPYYVSDCSAFVSWVWNIARTTTYYIPNVSTNLGSVTTYRATYTLQLGDALNSNAHVVLVSGLDYDANGAITRIEITEQTPPQMKRSYYTPSQLYDKYYNYTIQRYYGDVPMAPNQDEEPPVISNVKYSNVSAAGYTISCKVTDNQGIYRVAFPSWTVNNDQDDLAADFMNTQQGTKNGDIYTFRVNASDHNNEGGAYVTHIYAEDHAGNRSNLALPAVQVRNDNEKPVISNVRYSNVSSAGYTISCTVTDDWGVNSVAFPTWTVANGQDDLAANFLNTQLGTKNGDTYTFRVNASAHNNEGGAYVTHIYATDCAGNQVSLALNAVQVMNDTQDPVISDAVVSDVSAEGYTVTCKVTDNWGIDRVAFPTWTVANGQDDLAEHFSTTQLGTRNGDTFTFRVKASDHNNETGEYVTHIYAYDCAGNEVHIGLPNVFVTDADPIVVPEVTAKSFSLSFEDEILVNFYYTVSDTTNVAEQGMLVYYDMPSKADFAAADEVYTDSIYNPDDGRYMNTTEGIAAKEMGDTRYYCAYAKLSDGRFVYSKIHDYSPKKYAMNMLVKDTTSEKQKDLCVAMLNYGAAAQSYFGYNTAALMNADLTASQKERVIDFRKELFKGAVLSSKTTDFEETIGFTKKTASVSFESAFAINFYMTPSNAVAGNMTLYLWTPEAYAEASRLTAANATTMTMTKGDDGRYFLQVSGIPAKAVDKTYYVAAVYTDSNGNFCCTGIVPYSLSKYCINNANGSMGELAKATAMYGYYANLCLAK